MPPGYIEGNGTITIGYTANGEASDWMLHERGIYAVSPELGLNGHAYESFFIKTSKALEAVVAGNSHWVNYTMRLLVERVVCELKNSVVTGES